MRDFSQDESLHAGAPTALGTKSQPAGGIPVPPVAQADEIEVAMHFGAQSSLNDQAGGAHAPPHAPPHAMEEAMRVNWQQTRRHYADYAQVRPFIAHGYRYGRRWPF